VAINGRWRRAAREIRFVRDLLRLPESYTAAGADAGSSFTGTPFRIDCPMIGSTTASSTQSLYDTPACRPATDCQDALAA
jgi:hypothetical protein